MNKLYVIIILVQFIFSSCSDKPGSCFQCEWLHSQIVGHRALAEQNDKMSSFYITIKCSEVPVGSIFILRNKGGIQIDLKENYSTSDFLILSADIGTVDRFLGKEIRDSVSYKKTLIQQLDNSLLIRDNNFQIPKSNDYMTRFWYLERRIN